MHWHVLTNVADAKFINAPQYVFAPAGDSTISNKDCELSRQSKVAYIENVNWGVSIALLVEVLQSFGELKSFYLWQPNDCAFVEFAESSACAAAVAADTHVIGAATLSVRECQCSPGSHDISVPKLQGASSSWASNDILATTPFESPSAVHNTYSASDESDAESSASSISLDAQGFLEARERSARAEQQGKRLTASVAKWRAVAAQKERCRNELWNRKRLEAAAEKAKKSDLPQLISHMNLGGRHGAFHPISHRQSTHNDQTCHQSNQASGESYEHDPGVDGEVSTVDGLRPATMVVQGPRVTPPTTTSFRPFRDL